jgi:AraC-like DNA-binding protein
VFQGVLLILIACVILEIFMMYTGYIIHAFFLVDFSESIALAIGPLYYLIVISLTKGKVRRLHYLHVLPALLYTFYLVPFFALPEDAKYNAWVWAYRPEMTFRNIQYPYNSDPIGIRSVITEISLFSILVYSVLCGIETIRAFRKAKESFWKPVSPALQTLRTGALILASVSILVLLVKVTNMRDTGDHIFATYVALAVYLMSFSVIRNSSIFKQTPLNEPRKYKASQLSPETRQALTSKLENILHEHKPFLRSSFSLPELAKLMGTSVHTVSQVVNEVLNKSFFELIAELRVEEAKRLLKEQPNIKVEEIGEQVGYNSKSSFYNVFKKITGMTPAEYRLKM